MKDSLFYYKHYNFEVDIFFMFKLVKQTRKLKSNQFCLNYKIIYLQNLVGEILCHYVSLIPHLKRLLLALMGRN